VDRGTLFLTARPGGGPDVVSARPGVKVFLRWFSRQMKRVVNQ
jgi:hypothetical protein